MCTCVWAWVCMHMGVCVHMDGGVCTALGGCVHTWMDVCMCVHWGVNTQMCVRCMCTGGGVNTHRCVCRGPGMGHSSEQGVGLHEAFRHGAGGPELPRGVGELRRTASGPALGADALATPCAGLQVSLGLGCNGAAACGAVSPQMCAPLLLQDKVDLTERYVDSSSPSSSRGCWPPLDSWCQAPLDIRVVAR